MNRKQERARAQLLAGLDAGKAQAQVDRRLAAERSLRLAVDLLPVESVHLRDADTRPARADHVLALAETVGALGLLQPLTVDRAGRLVDGLHRLTACRLLAAPPDGRAALLGCLTGADTLDAGETAERLDALPAPEALPEPLRAGKVPVRRLVDLDAQADPDGALAAEAAANTARRDYTRPELLALVGRLRAAGYRETTGRPRRGERALRPALELVLGINRGKARRLLDSLAGARKVAVSATFDDLHKAAGRLDRAARAYIETLDDALGDGRRAPFARDLGRQARVITGLAQAAREELATLGGSE
jgi:hypothetical protein